MTSLRIDSLPYSSSTPLTGWVFIERDGVIKKYKDEIIETGYTFNIINTLSSFNLIIFIPEEGSSWQYSGDNSLDGKGWYASLTYINDPNSDFVVTDYSLLENYQYTTCGSISYATTSSDNDNIEDAKPITGSSFSVSQSIDDGENLYYKLDYSSNYTYHLYIEDKSSNPNNYSGKIVGTIVDIYENQIVEQQISSDPQSGVVTIDYFSDATLYIKTSAIYGEGGKYNLRMERKTTNGDNLPPQINFVYPENGEDYVSGEPVNIMVNPWDYDGTVSIVEYYINEIFMGFSTTYPHQFNWDTSGQSDGLYTIRVMAKDDFSNQSNEVEISILLGTNIYFFEDFESGGLNEWTLIDNDGDGIDWSIESNVTGYESLTAITSHSYYNPYHIPLTPDNYLISKQFNIAQDSKLSYRICLQDEEFDGEHYSVLISTTTPNIEDFTEIFSETLYNNKEQGEWKSRTIRLNDYSGNIYFAFRHYDTYDRFAITLDNIKLYND
jgi:hypothetical protein